MPLLLEVIPHEPDPSELLQRGLERLVLAGITYMVELGPLILSLDADPDVRREVGRSLVRRRSTARDAHQQLSRWIRLHPEAASLTPAAVDTMSYMIIGACQHYLTMVRANPKDVPAPPTFARRVAKAAAQLTDVERN